MPQCPYCKTHYELGKQYCDTCESYLLHPEEGDTFCPQCGIRVSPRQEICHKCDAPLPASAAAKALADSTAASSEGAGPMAEQPGSTPIPPPSETLTPPAFPQSAHPSMPSWVMGSLAGGGLIILLLVILVVFLLSRGEPPPAPLPTPIVETKPPETTLPQATFPSPGAETPPAEVPLKEQLSKVLQNLRDAQLKQDILLYMSCYSYLYPKLDDRRQTTLESWKNYRFTKLVFFLDEVKSRGPDSSIAQVTWDIQVQDQSTQKVKNLTQTFRVGFAKELGSWRIRSLDELEEGED